MSVTTSSLTTHSRFGGAVQHPFVTQNDGTDKLLIMLPGHGYLVDYPLFYYLRAAALKQGYDALSVQYAFQVGGQPFSMERMPDLLADSLDAVQAALARGYRRVVLAGKSLGTPLAGQIASGLSGVDVRLILFTPVGGAHLMTSGLPALALIGTADERYSAAAVAEQHPGLRWRVFDGLDHSLEVRWDWRASLAALPEIIAACEGFLTEA